MIQIYKADCLLSFGRSPGSLRIEFQNAVQILNRLLVLLKREIGKASIRISKLILRVYFQCTTQVLNSLLVLVELEISKTSFLINPGELSKFRREFFSTV